MMTWQSRETLRMFVSFVGVIAVLAGLFPQLLTGVLGLMLIAGATISAILTVVLDVRFGKSLKKSLLGVLLFGAIVFGLIYGLIWYLMSRAVSGELWNFESLKGFGK